MKKILKQIGLSLCSLCLCGLMTNGEEQMKEIVVTATRSDKQLLKVPANITVITERDIRNSGGQTIQDLLRPEVSLVVRDYTAAGKTVNLDIRGFGEVASTNVLVLVDSRRVTQIDLSGTDWSQIPLNRVSRIEVIRGTGSVLYGDNATAGVINIITKEGFGKPRGEIRTLAGSYGMKSFLGELTGGNENFTYSASQRSNQTNGYRKNSYLNTEDGNLRLGLKFSDSLCLDYSLGSHNDKYGLPGYLSETELKTLGPRATTSPDDWADTQDNYHKLQVKNTLPFGTIITDLTMRNRQSHLEWISWAWVDTQYIDSIHVTPRYILESRSIAGLNIPFKFTGGVDVLKDKGYSEANDFIAKKQEWGIYQLSEFTVNKANLSLGYRNDLVKYHFKAPVQDTKTRDKKGVCQIGLSYLYAPLSSFYVNYAQNFRNPVVDEYFSTWTGLNTQLKPQAGNQIEGGLKHTLTKQLYTTLSIFRTDIKDEIFYNKPFGANENYDGKTRRQGWESSLTYKPIETIKTTLNYTTTDSKFRDGLYSGNEIPGTPHHKATTAVSAQLIKGLDFSIQSNYVGKQYLISDVNNLAEPLNAYTTVDTKIIYQGENLSAYVGVNNLFNRQYTEYGVVNATATLRVFYPSPERNYSAGLSIGF